MTTTVLTSKFQTTIPKAIRKLLGLEIHDIVEWRVEAGKAVLVPSRTDFLANQGKIKIGAGDVLSDIKKARLIRAEKYK